VRPRGFADRPAVLTDRSCIRLYRTDLRGVPARPASPTHSSRRQRTSQFAVTRSTGRLITDIWRTGSGPSKRSGAPLALTDGDGIRSPGRDGERQGFWSCGIRACASPATAHRLPLCRTNPCEGPRHQLRHSACWMHRSTGATRNMISMDRPRAWHPTARHRPPPAPAV